MKHIKYWLAASLPAVMALTACIEIKQTSVLDLKPNGLKVVNEVDPRYQSYNIEMVEVVGGKFWRPYSTMNEVKGDKAKKSQDDYGIDVSSGNESLYRKLDPVNLAEPKLMKLAQGLAPAYVRTSGTWANAVYFQNDGQPARPAPKGFVNVLTVPQWKDLLDFVKATDSKLVTSFAVCDGVRDKSGVWTPVEAQKLIDFSTANGVKIAGAELFNEPTMPMAGGEISNTKYNVKNYAKDIAAYTAWNKAKAPYMLQAGPGTVGEGVPGFVDMFMKMNPVLTEDAMKTVAKGSFDVFSYHFYGAGSERVCKEPPFATRIDSALTHRWISLTDTTFSFFNKIHDQYMPGSPIWITETAEAAGGGDRWANTYLDTFRYLYQLGSLAQKGVDVIFHNTLAASEYSLIDQDTHNPNPNYWAAYLWNKFMGTKSYGTTINQNGVYVFAHNTKSKESSLTFLVINPTEEARQITMPASAKIYAVSANGTTSRAVNLNGKPLELSAENQLPAVEGVSPKDGKAEIAPKSWAFISL